MRAGVHNVLLCYLRQWDFKVYLMCHVYWLNTKYMVAISNHHLLYWFVSSGTVIKKAIDLLSLFAYGLFINFTHCFLFLGYNFYVFFPFKSSLVLSEVGKKEQIKEKRKEAISCFLLVLTERQRLRKEWTARWEIFEKQWVNKIRNKYISYTPQNSLDRGQVDPQKKKVKSFTD